MTTAKSKAPLLSASDLASAYPREALDTDDVELPSGVVVRVRGLLKAEQLRLTKTHDPESDLGAFQAELFRMGVMTDGDPLTTEQVQAIIDTWPMGAFDAVLEAIMEVSGMNPTFREGHEDRDGTGV